LHPTNLSHLCDPSPIKMFIFNVKPIWKPSKPCKYSIAKIHLQTNKTNHTQKQQKKCLSLFPFQTTPSTGTCFGIFLFFINHKKPSMLGFHPWYIPHS
jgi:hypothetical protein